MLKIEKNEILSLAWAVYEILAANALSTDYSIYHHPLMFKVHNWQGTFTYSNEYLTILNYTSCPS